MKREIRLLYFKGCPNVEQARANVRAALCRSGLAERWEEMDLETGECPDHWRGFPSPTILVDDTDVVSGAKARPGSSSCRAGGAPSPEQIAAALASDRSWFAGFASIPAVAVGALPASVCPACYPALAGFISALGLGASADRVTAPLTATLLLVAVAGLAYQARKSRSYWPLGAGVAGAVAMYVGQFVLMLPAVKAGGISLLVGASFWNVVPKLKNFRRHDCPACEQGKR